MEHLPVGRHGAPVRLHDEPVGFAELGVALDRLQEDPQISRVLHPDVALGRVLVDVPGTREIG